MPLSNDFIEFDVKDVEQSIPARFLFQVRKHPERIAVKTSNFTFTYHELNVASNRLARVLISMRSSVKGPVAILLDHDCPIVVSIMSVLKAGLCYVPLDPSHPGARTSVILMDSGADVIITDDANLAPARELATKGQRLISLDDIPQDVPESDLTPNIPPGTIAYILYTAGSTGVPKGVMQTHRNVLHNVMKYTNGVRIACDDRLSQLPYCTFAASVSDLFGALLNGASLHLFDLRKAGLARLADWLIREEITIYHSVPTVFRHFAAHLSGTEKFPKLRLIKLGGEPVYRKDVETYQRHFSQDCVLHIGLGSTEMNIIRQFFVDRTTRFDGNIVPVGYEVRDTEVILLDEDGHCVGFNEPGEIVIKSRYLSPGYWQWQELTNSNFPGDAKNSGERTYRTGDMGFMYPDGCLVHIGRKDFQVKVRGHRIELAEVEGAILQLPDIKEAAVIVRVDQSGEQRLIAYLVKKSSDTSIDTLRRHLREQLPDYMVPSGFVFLNALPLTPGWKVDRNALPAPDTVCLSSEPLIAPRTFMEESLVRIWSEVLSLEIIGVRDSFIDLGGHSLLDARIINEIEKAFGIRLPAGSIIRENTIERLAHLIGKPIAP